MEQKSCFGEFARYSVLSILGTLGVSCYILADTFFISEGMGINGLAALNLAIPIFNFIYGIGLMLGMGGATKFSICKSRGDREQGNQVFSHAVSAGLAAGLFFFVAGLFFSGELAEALGGEGQVLAMTDTYLKWLLLFAPAFILNNILLCFVRNDGGPQLSTAAMLVGNFANILFDYIFIFPMGMGILGAILATGFSPVLSILCMSPHWLRKKNHFSLVRFIPSARLLQQELSIGLPSLIAQVSAGVVMIVFNMLILGLEGNRGVAAYGVVANIALVVTATYNGLSQGMQPLVSSFYGGGREREYRQVLRYGLSTMLVISAALYLIVFLLAEPIAGLFNSERDMPMQAMAAEGLALYFLSNVFVGFNMLLATFFASVEKPVPAHILSLLRGFLLIIPLAFLMAKLWGMTGIWLTYPAAEFLTAAVGLALYRRFRAAGKPRAGHGKIQDSLCSCHNSPGVLK